MIVTMAFLHNNNLYQLLFDVQMNSKEKNQNRRKRKNDC